MCVKEKGPKEVLQEPRCKGFKECEGRQEDSREGIFYHRVSLRRQFLKCRM